MTRKMMVLAGLVALLVLGGAMVAGVWMQRDGMVAGIGNDARKVEADADSLATDADAIPDDLVRQTQPLYYSFDPAITVNIKDTDAVFQVGISLSTHFATTNDALKNDDPALRSAIILALADASQDLAESDAGKKRMLTQIVTVVNRQLQQDRYAGSVDGAYFTSFIVQGGVDD